MRRVALLLAFLLLGCRSGLPEEGRTVGDDALQGGAAATEGAGGSSTPQGAGGGNASSGASPGSAGGTGGGSLVDTCYVGHADCADACALVDCCAGAQDLMAECMTACEQSIWVGGGHQMRCLALRVFWIDEEGCGSIVETYEAFDLSDDCTGEQP